MVSGSKSPDQSHGKLMSSNNHCQKLEDRAQSHNTHQGGFYLYVQHPLKIPPCFCSKLLENIILCSTLHGSPKARWGVILLQINLFVFPTKHQSWKMSLSASRQNIHILEVYRLSAHLGIVFLCYTVPFWTFNYVYNKIIIFWANKMSRTVLIPIRGECFCFCVWWPRAMAQSSAPTCSGLVSRIRGLSKKERSSVKISGKFDTMVSTQSFVNSVNGFDFEKW